MRTFAFKDRPTHLAWEFLTDRLQHEAVLRMIDHAFADAADADDPYFAAFDDYFVVARKLAARLDKWLSPVGKISGDDAGSELAKWLLCEVWEQIDMLTVAEALLCFHQRWAPDVKAYPYTPEFADQYDEPNPTKPEEN